MLSTTTLNNWKREGRAFGARAMLVVFDRFAWPPEPPYPVYIGTDESIADKFAALDGVGFQHVHAVHLLSRS